jgi:3-phosphoshikimate 1-carboxyvinyltransferase
MTRFICDNGGHIEGQIRVPGDKSISHRSIILASIAQGDSLITGFLLGEDSLNTIKAFQQMGVAIDRNQDQVKVKGVGINGLQQSTDRLDMGNSGTAMRLLLGLLSGQLFDSCLTGDESLSSRPMNRVIMPLQSMGAEIVSEEGGRSPLQVKGGRDLKAIEYDMPVASAQVKSCLLLAGLYASGETIIREPAPTRDHSERMLKAFGCDLNSHDSKIKMRGGQQLKACDIEVPADISSAAFFMVAATIAPASKILLLQVGINPTRTGVIDILKLMGADINLLNKRELGGEPVADIQVSHANLKGIDIPEHLVPLAIDEFPVLFVAAACATGITRLSGAEELRVKESDRIQVMADGLQKLGIEVETKSDGIIIQGGNMTGGEVESHGDHRTAMAFTIASLRANGGITINNCDNVATSFPGFVDLARQSGIRVSKYDN